MGLNVFQSRNVLLPTGARPASLVVDETTGKITAIQEWNGEHAYPVVDVGSMYLLPGLVDAHVHLNEPGRTDWEGFWTGTRAAISGGVTTLVDMPLNSIPPTTTVPNLEGKRQAALGKCFTDVAFWGGVIPGNQADLKPLLNSGVKGFKCFLIESGVEEFPCVSENDLKDSMQELQNTSTVLLFHAELATGSNPSTSPAVSTVYSDFLESRPQQLETDAISLITTLQKTYPALRCHIVHLSAAAALPVIRAAKATGLNLTVETCYHYLCLSSEEIPHGHPEFKCCPPIREADNKELLWAALHDGTIDCVVSDHSPCIASLKNLDDGNIMGAWGGISTLGLGLSLLWTEGRKRGVTIEQISNWTSLRTAQHAGLADSKGLFKVGHDADIIVWNPDIEFEVTKESMNFKNKVSPYENKVLVGRVEQSYLRGHLVYDGLAGVFAEPIGQLL